MFLICNEKNKKGQGLNGSFGQIRDQLWKIRKYKLESSSSFYTSRYWEETRRAGRFLEQGKDKS